MIFFRIVITNYDAYYTFLCVLVLYLKIDLAMFGGDILCQVDLAHEPSIYY